MLLLLLFFIFFCIFLCLSRSKLLPYFVHKRLLKPYRVIIAVTITDGGPQTTASLSPECFKRFFIDYQLTWVSGGCTRGACLSLCPFVVDIVVSLQFSKFMSSSVFQYSILLFSCLQQFGLAVSVFERHAAQQ